jgi:O-antigen ligase
VGTAGSALVFAPFAADVFMLPKLWIAAAAASIGWGAWWTARPRARTEVPRPVLLAVSALLGLTALATVVSRTPLTSLVGSAQRYGGVLSLIVYLAFAALVVVTVAGRPGRARVLALTVLGSAMAVALYAVLQRVGIDVFDFREASGAPTRYPGSTVGNSNFAGAYCAIALPFATVLERDARRWLRRGAPVAVAVLVLGIWSTQSRAAMVAASVGTAVVGVGLLRRHSSRAARGLTMIVAVVAAAFFLFAVAVVVTGGDAVPGGDRAEVLRTDSARVRGFEWEAAWRAFVARPLLGHGPDTFGVTYTQYRSRADGARLGAQLSDKPHNVVLERAQDSGVLGVVAYGAVVLAALGVRRRTGSSRTPWPPVQVATTGALAAYLTQACFSIDVPPLALAGWIVLAMLVAERSSVTTPRASTRQARTYGRESRAKVPAPPAPLVVGALAAALAAVPLAADISLAAAEDADRTGEMESAARHYDRAIALRPTEPAYRRAAGFLAERRGVAAADRGAQKALLADAARHYTAALSRRPGYVPFLVDLGRIETLRGQHVDPRHHLLADAHFRQAVRRDPHDWQLRSLYAAALTAWAGSTGDPAPRARAADELAAWVRLRPRDFDAWIALGRTRLALGDPAGAREAAARAGALAPLTREVWELETAAEALQAAGDSRAP